MRRHPGTVIVAMPWTPTLEELVIHCAERCYHGPKLLVQKSILSRAAPVIE